LKLKFRNLQASDIDWLAEDANDPEAAKYAVSIYPETEHEINEYLRKELEEGKSKNIVAELDGEPAGNVAVWTLTGRNRHIAWLGIGVRRKHWGKGVGSALMQEAVSLAKELGCRKLMLGTTEGNERAIRLYRKFGFEVEAYEDDEVYVDDSWRKNYIMGLELAPCEPKLPQPGTSGAEIPTASSVDVQVRHFVTRDVDEINRLQNCPESTKSTDKIPPITKEESKKWYEELKTMEGKHCLACFREHRLLGYLKFRAGRLPFPSLKFEEMIVDLNEMPNEAADALLVSVKSFKERYGYRRIFAYVAETALPIVSALEHHGFKKAGAMKDYYFIDGYYVNSAVYGYP